jgi:hypothetical protein
MTEERYAELRDMDREWDREEQGEMCAEAYIARAAEARLLKETTKKDATIRALADALDAIRDGRTHLGQHDPAKIAAAVRRIQ